MLALGAHGAVLGTRLAATKESMYSQEKKVLLRHLNPFPSCLTPLRFLA